MTLYNLRVKRRIDLKRKIHNQPKEKFGWMKKINIFKYLSLLLFFLIVLSIPSVVKKLIKINTIECFSQLGDCPTDLNSKLTASKDYDFYIVKKYLSDVLDKDIQVSSYLIQYKIPSTVKVDLTLKNPKYAMKNQDLIHLIDKDGVVINIVTESKLSALSSNAVLNLGDKVDNKTKFALDVFQKIVFLYPIDSGIIENNELKINMSGVLLRIPLEGEVDHLVGSTRLIFSRLNGGQNGIKMEDIKEIDLRFANPVIR